MAVIFHIGNVNKKKGLRSGAQKTANGDMRLKGSNGVTLLLIHGLTGTPNEMRAIAEHFNKKGYSVFCPRLAYHGEPIDVLKKAKWQDFYASARKAYLDVRKTETGPVFAAGLSMGALLSLLLAEEFGEGVNGICCLAPTLFYDGWNVPPINSLLPIVKVPEPFLVTLIAPVILPEPVSE